MTKVKLELMTDRKMHDVVDKGVHGSVCCISHKYAAANNPLLGASFDASRSNSFILYLDMNNLYGTAICKPLPEKDFDFLRDEQVTLFDFMSVLDDTTEGYILEVDLEYPEEIHDMHSDYPFRPESLVVNPKDLPPFTVSLETKLSIKTNGGCRKLTGTLRSKERYALHYHNLKLYVKLGMKVKKFIIILFTQSKWLKAYIDFNTKQSQKAPNDFEKDFFKLMNNAVFGKTMENVRKHQNVQLMSEHRKFKRLSSKPNF